jgi:methylenetetrahydrofolate dehydrogenase (NADP+) / methenyltetrahydrofolate cyclohydrolase
MQKIPDRPHMTTVFDGKVFATKLEKSLNVVGSPKLAAILIGEDPASVMYVNLKKKAAERVGCVLEVYRFASETPQSEIVQLIQSLSEDTSVHGIMVQMPIPDTLDKGELINNIALHKDVDGLRENSAFLPATIAAIIKIMQEAEVKEEDSIAIVGSKGEVGSRLIKILRSKKCSVMEIDIDTQNPLEITRMADVVISCTGRANLVTDEWVKKNAVIIDIGAPIQEVQFSKVAPKVRFITPVPGGVGPVTVACLIENLVKASV